MIGIAWPSESWTSWPLSVNVMAPCLPGASQVYAPNRHSCVRYLSNLDIRRSARIFPPVWQVGQYWRLESANDTSRMVSPQTAQVSPVRPCTRIDERFESLRSRAASPSARCNAPASSSTIAAYSVATSSLVSDEAGWKGESLAACSTSSE